MLKSIISFLLILFVFLPSLAQDGKELFRQNCAFCHKIGARMVGPDLTGVHNKRDRAWLIKFIHSSQAMIKSGDTASINIYKSFGNVIMPDQAHLSNKDIEAIIDFIASGKSDMSEQSQIIQATDEKETPPPVVINKPAPEKFLSPAERKQKITDGFTKRSIIALFVLAIVFSSIALVILRGPNVS